MAATFNTSLERMKGEVRGGAPAKRSLTSSTVKHIIQPVTLARVTLASVKPGRTAEPAWFDARGDCVHEKALFSMLFSMLFREGLELQLEMRGRGRLLS